MSLAPKLSSGTTRRFAHVATLVALAILQGVDAVRGDEVRLTPLSPAEEAATFKLADDWLSVELVAAEPQLDSPVAICWDAAGRMYVAEMIDYPVGPTAGRIRLLEDCDSDGQYKHATVFAEGLRFPNGVLASNGGVLVTAAPDILFLKDTDGDGRADEKTVLFTGFAEGNQQLRCNGLTWGLDGWIYGANGRSDGAVRRPNDPADAAVSIRTRDFRFLPDGSRFEATSGQSQFSQTRDDWGNRFLAWNTVPIRHAALEQSFLDRNPRLAMQGVRDIADPADDGRVFPISPRPQTFNRERTDFYNALCGLTIYRGDLLGSQYEGNAFVGESLTGLVHRRVLEPSGATFVSRRGEQGREFLASTDSWFHPVYMTTGPDGALYVVDFYRRWVEHPAFVAETLRQGVDFRQGAGHGRIWRVAPRDAMPRKFEPLDKLSVAELAAQLASPNGWRRDTAQRLLVERKAGADPKVRDQAIASITQLAREATLPQVRLQAMATLGTFAQLDEASLLAAIGDRDPRVAAYAVRLAAPQLSSNANLQFSSLMAAAGDTRIRFQAVLALREWDEPQKVAVMSRLARLGVDDPLVSAAIVGSLGKNSTALVEELLWGIPHEKADRWQSDPTAARIAFLKEAAAVAAAQDTVAIKSLTSRLEKAPSVLGLAVWVGLHASADRRRPDGAADDAAGREGLVRLAEKLIRPSDAIEIRLLAIEALPLIDANRSPALVELLEAQDDPRVQAAAARALVGADAATAARMLAVWSKAPLSTRRAILSSALRWPAGTAALLEAMEQEEISLQELEAGTREALLALRDEALRDRAKRIFDSAPPPADRQAVLARFEPALKRSGDRALGAAVFEKHCLTCHHVQGRGARVGPDLSGIGARPKETLLVDILDPNRQVAPEFNAFTLVTAGGQVFSGILAGESAAGVTLRRAEGATDFVPRGEIELLRSSGKSLMPEGLDAQLSEQSLADLLAFLAQPDTGLFSPAK